MTRSGFGYGRWHDFAQRSFRLNVASVIGKFASFLETASPPDVRQGYVTRYERPTAGFAARCEARLCLAVGAPLKVGAMPPVRPLAPKTFRAKSRTFRAKPEPRA